MPQKDFIALCLILIGILGGCLLTCISKRARDFFFAAMIFLAPKTEDYDVNFVSRDFYRGTTRGFEFSLVDILSISLLVSAILFPRRGESRVFWPASFGFMLLFFAYACFNVGMSDPRLFGMFELSKMLRGVTIFLAVAFYLRSERELKWLLWALGLSLCYQGLEGIWQRFRYNMERVPGTLDDSNSLSVFFCTTAPLFVAAVNSRLPKLLKWVSAAAIGLAYIGVLLTVCRTGFVVILSVIVLTTALTISMRLTAQKMVFAVVIAIVGSAVTARSWESLQARFSQANLKVEFGKNRSLGRGYYLRVAKSIMDDRFFGVGLNNWSYWVSQKYGPSLGYRFVHYKGTDVEPSTAIPTGSNVDEAQAAPAHSLGALTAGEMGIPGLVLFGLLWLRWFQMGASFLWTRTPDPMRRIGVGLAIGLLGIFLHSLTEWVFRQSPIYYVIHILLGALASLYYLKRQQARQAIVEESRELEPKVWAEPSAVHA